MQGKEKLPPCQGDLGSTHFHNIRDMITRGYNTLDYPPEAHMAAPVCGLDFLYNLQVWAAG